MLLLLLAVWKGRCAVDQTEQVKRKALQELAKDMQMKLEAEWKKWLQAETELRAEQEQWLLLIL